MALITAAQIAAAAASEIPKIIRDGIEKEIGGRPDFIASGTPESLAGQIGQAAGRSACRRYGAGESGLTGRAAANAERVCRPYLDGLGQGAAPTIKTPFSGGQCEGIIYRITYTAQSINTDGSLTAPETRTGNAFGPIFGVQGRGSPAFQSVVALTGQGEQTLSSGNCAQGCFANIQFVSLTPLFGEPDNCGDPPPVVTGPEFAPDPTPPPFRFNPGPGIDVPISVDINPDGTINFDIGTGPITVDAFNGDRGGGDDASGDDGGGAGGGAPPGDVGAPGAPSDPGAGGESEGEAPPGSVLTGLRLEVLEFPSSRTLQQEDVFRAACYVYMGVPGLLDLDPAGLNLSADQFVFAEQSNLTNWRVRANNGYRIRTTPYYRAAE